MNLHVDGLAACVTHAAIRVAFAKFGEVNAVSLPTSLAKGGPHRGYAFVRMRGGRAALALDGQERFGRKIRVRIARPPRGHR